MFHGVILIRSTAKDVKNAVDEIKKVKSVTEAYPVFGRFDAVAFIEAKDYPELKNIVKKVLKIKGITGTETLPEGD